MPISSNDIDPTWQDGVLITDTFDVWRKKTNGIIDNYSPIITNANIADNTIQSIKLAPPAPSWDQTTGTVTTNGTVGAFIVKGGFTSGTASSINVGDVAAAAPALSITSGTQSLRFNPNSTAASWNPLVSAGDYSIIGGASAGDAKNIIIGKWSSNAHAIVISSGRVGINKVAMTDAFEVNGNISAAGSITGTSLSAGSGAISTTGAITGGAITGTSFSGPLTGNVTGNVSGSSGSCTGNSLTATSATSATTASKVANSLTAGSYLTSTGTFDGSTARTFAVDADVAATANKIALRGADGALIAAAPTLSTHLTTKAYVDAVTKNNYISRIDWVNIKQDDTWDWYDGLSGIKIIDGGGGSTSQYNRTGSLARDFTKASYYDSTSGRSTGRMLHGSAALYAVTNNAGGGSYNLFFNSTSSLSITLMDGSSYTWNLTKQILVNGTLQYLSAATSYAAHTFAFSILGHEPYNDSFDISRCIRVYTP